ncbi:hypothetical protein GCM10007036_07980 [Alsobacter metallidurans]|uniref:Uncharacterized protein n=1 Tax=Alsobacter metallidurans TaxID=340221 RepID=A0A917MFU8_9HYPH|nr:hypothetical protein GCM10007036_07980 [Alsobacter metallidurans]
MQFAQIEGLDHVVISAKLERDDVVDHVGPAGEHDDAQVRLGPNLASDLEAVLSRENDVDQEDVWLIELDTVQKAFCALSRRNPEPLIFKVSADHQQY